MSKTTFKCAECGKQRANKAGLKCFFCESGERIAGLQSDLRSRGKAAEHNARAREVKHSHRHFVARGKIAGQR